jgi:cell division cycle protein 37
MAGFNYARWDKLELSDDEDTHPGAQFIEKNTLRRIKRESHEVREQERLDKVKALQEAQSKGARGEMRGSKHACLRLVCLRADAA